MLGKRKMLIKYMVIWGGGRLENLYLDYFINIFEFYNLRLSG